MAVSNSTKLDVVNNVLLQVGERRVVSSTDNTAAQKVVSLLPEALLELETEYDFPFMRRYQTCDNLTWATPQTVQLPTDFKRLDTLQTVTGSITQHAAYIPATVFPNTPNREFSENDYVRYYTMPSDATLTVNPYPRTSVLTDREKIILEYIAHLTVPALDTDTFNMPETFIVLLVKLLVRFMAMRHIEDAALTQVVSLEYDRLVRRLKIKENALPKQQFLANWVR